MIQYFRAKIQSIYRGTVTQIDPESVDLPSRLPRPLMVGTKVFAKLNGHKDGVYAGTIDATQDDGYRVVFEKENLFPTSVVRVCLAYTLIDPSNNIIGRSSYECSTTRTTIVIIFSYNK